MILIKEKLRMMLKLYIIKICYAARNDFYVQVCNSFLFPQKRGEKYPL